MIEDPFARSPVEHTERRRSEALRLTRTRRAILATLLVVGLGVHDVAIMGFPLVVLVAGLLLRRIAFGAVLTCAAGSLVSVMWAESRGIIVTPLSDSTDLIDDISILVVLIAVAIFVRLLVRAFSESLEWALASERTLAEANRELESRTARLQAQDAEQERLNGALTQAAAEWQRTFDSVDTSLLILDRDGRITRINRGAGTSWEWTTPQFWGAGSRIWPLAGSGRPGPKWWRSPGTRAPPPRLRPRMTPGGGPGTSPRAFPPRPRWATSGRSWPSGTSRASFLGLRER